MVTDQSTAARGRGRPRLPLERIVTEAVALIDDEGSEALSLRDLAARLGSSTSTLYRHFENRADLVRTVVDHIFSEVDDFETDGLDWDQALTELAIRMFAMLERHRNVTPLILLEVPSGPHMQRLRGRAIAVLEDAGFNHSDSVRIYATVMRFVLGFGVQSSRTETEVRRSEPQFTLAEEFRFGLQLMVEGLRLHHASRVQG